MQRLYKAALAAAAVTLTWMPSFTVAADGHPGLQFAIQPGTGDFVQFQSGPIKEGHKTHVYYDSLRVSSANPECPDFGNLRAVTGHVMSDNSGIITKFSLGSLNPPTIDYVKIGSFVTPKCHKGSTEIQMWFTGTDGKKTCYDSNFSKNYSFPVICK
jgi:hypothetical protein